MELTVRYEGIEQREGRWCTVAERVYELKKTIKRLKFEEEQLKKELIDLSNNVASHGNGYLFKPYERKGTVDYSAIPELKNVDLELYRNPTITSWKLDVL